MPTLPAVRSTDGELTYGELADRTAALAATLQALGVRRGDRVGVYLHKSVAAFAAVHGVLRAGAAYVPIDPFAPVNLVAALVQDCGIEVLVSETRMAPQLARVAQLGSGVRAVVGPAKPIDGLVVVAQDQLAPATELATPPSLSEDIAYVMYTSGSTGKPKGIVHTHRSGLSYARAAVQVYGVRARGPLGQLGAVPLRHLDLRTLRRARWPQASTLVIPEPYLKMPASLVPVGCRRSIHVLVLGAVPVARTGGSRRAGIAGSDQLALGAVRR